MGQISLIVMLQILNDLRRLSLDSAVLVKHGRLGFTIYTLGFVITSSGLLIESVGVAANFVVGEKL